MNDNIKKLLRQKHLLIIGKSEKERRDYITDIIRNVNFDTFRFPAKMKPI